MSSTTSPKPRLASLDQFRGYTVAGMFLVNFLGYEWMPPVFLHHHTYCSYADTIMPQFLFAVGFAMRLSFGRRVQAQGLAAGYWRMVRRILGLLLVALAVYTEGRAVDAWNAMVDAGAWNVAFPYLKRHWLQTLGQIALTSLWILPVIRARAPVRIAFMLVSGAAHVVLSHYFAYHWVNTDPNGIDGGPLGFLTWTIPTIIGTLTCDAIVGAPGRPPLLKLAFLAVLIMGLGYVFSCGTRLYDLSPAQLAQLKESRRTQDAQKKKLNDQADELKKKIGEHNEAIKKTEERIAELRRARIQARFDELKSKPENAGRPRSELIDSAVELVDSQKSAGEIVRLSDDLKKSHSTDTEFDDLKRQIADLRSKAGQFLDVKLAPHPVIPPSETWEGRTWRDLLAEPPFVQPPADDPRMDPPPHDIHRFWNYWMMTQRGGSLSYVTFAAGFSLLVYLLFYVLADIAHIRIGLFRTFGTNALAGYVLAGIIGTAVQTFIPAGAPPWYVLTAFCIDFFLVWLFVRTLEKNGIFLRV